VGTGSSLSGLDLPLQSRRWDLFDLVLERGGDLKSVDVYSVLGTHNAELYELPGGGV
jgi:hypothetical protein